MSEWGPEPHPTAHSTVRRAFFEPDRAAVALWYRSLMPLVTVLAAFAPVVHLRQPAGHGQVDDGELVARARGRDAGALHELYLRHVRRVAARVTRLLGRSAEAEDVVQDAFLEAFRDLARLRDPSRFEAWLNGIAVHQAHRRLRRRQMRLRLGLDVGTDDAALERLVAPGSDPTLGLELAKLDAALRDLDADLRLAFMLRVVEGCELGEVARLCRCSLATAKRRIAKARALIARRMDLTVLDEVSR
jgi:RNA polymerase sigma-70 factor (ECF subfamily)